VLLAFVYFVGFDQMKGVLVGVHLLVIVAMVLIQLSGFAFYATAWYVLIRAAGYRMPLVTCQGVAFASIFASYTTPSGILLEAMRCLLGSKETGMTIGESTATVILHRILYVIGFLASTASALLALELTGDRLSSSFAELAILPVATLIVLSAVLYLSFEPKRLEPLLKRVLRFLEPLFRMVQKEARSTDRTEAFLEDYKLSFRKMLASKQLIGLSFAASLGDWICSVLILYVVLSSLGGDISFWAAMITVAVGRMIQMTPIAIPGMLGIYETAITTSLTLFGVPLAVAASAAILLRVVTFWLELPITGIAAHHYGYKWLTHRAPRGPPLQP